MISKDKNILVLAAMPQELEAFIAELDVRGGGYLGPFRYFVSDAAGGNTIYSALCGPGKVNSSACVAAFLSQRDMNIGFVLNTGTAGALASGLRKGDIVVGSRYCQHDYDLTALYEGYEAGRMAGKDNIYDVVPQVIIETLPRLDDVYFGAIASGDKFVTGAIMIENVVPMAVDMESAAIAHLCYHLYNVPFIAVRVITDNADENANTDWQTFMVPLSRKAAAYARLVIDTLFCGKEYAKQPT